MKANYHTHTARCQHAVGDDREYVEAAIERGLDILGFSDHCPWIFNDGYVSNIRMLPSQLDNYFDSIERLKKEYAADITLYAGFEAEYIPSLMEKQDKLLADYPVDYMILGQHFLGVENDSVYTGQPTQDDSRLIRYVDTVIEAMDSGRYLYIAHPDLIHYTGSAALYEQEMTRLCQYLKKRQIPIELNLLGALEGRNYPSDRFLQIAKKAGNSCILGIDAHNPKQILEMAGYNRCMQWVESYHFNLISEINMEPGNLYSK